MNNGYKFRLNSFESNTGNYFAGKNWELSMVYGTVSGVNSEFSNDIFLVSLSKRLNDHNLYFRYTPGFTQEFTANSKTSISSGDSSITELLSTSISYQEKFGLGYSYSLTKNISAGVSLRYFHQDLNKENIEFIYGDGIFAEPQTVNETRHKKYWRTDFGISYFPSNDLSVSVSTSNLLLLNENGSFGDYHDFELRNDKSVILGFEYSLQNNFNAKLNYENTNSFGSGVSYGIDLWGGIITAGIFAFHDKYQDPFICSIMPSVSYSSRLLNFSVTGLKYFSDRTDAKPISYLSESGIHNILNNQFSMDKILFSVNLALSFTPEKAVEFVDVKIKDEIYPTLSEEYTKRPFAVASVVNLSDEIVNVKPSSFIDELNEDRVYSPAVNINAHDTVEIAFYTIIAPEKFQIKNRTISQAQFYLSVSGNDYDDELSKPILINDRNGWDGKVKNLRYFITNDYQFSVQFAKNVLAGYKDELSTVDNDLSVFVKTKILFNSFVKQMLYVADPRSSSEYVQFPEETIQRKGGDCDDLSVAFSSILESVGIQTALVDYKSDEEVNHVNLLVNTKLKPGQASSITKNDKKYFIRKNNNGEDEIWIPIEITSLTDFETAWVLGADKFFKEAVDKLGLAKETVKIVEIY